ncbi:MAG: hypothetical protein RhofKO_21930 [Rhodothermales bacterium]
MRPSLQLLASCFIAGLFFPLSVRAQVADISYTVSPEGTYLLWSDDAGLENGLGYGGRIGFGFGQFAELSGLYQRGTFTSEISALSANANLAALANAANRDVTMSRYGGALKLNIARGGVIPFLQAGTGILRLAPDGLDENETIYLEGGVGLQFSVANRYTLLLQAQNLAYRYKPAQLFLDADERGLLLETNPAFETQNVRNWALTASLQVYLGGREPGTYTDLDDALQAQLGEGLKGVRLPIEPFIGRVSFADALGFADDQRVAGLFTGIDLGPYVGLRGFYWRGLADESLTDFVDLQSYGGELRLRMAADRGNIQPFFALGGGYLDVLSGYTAETGATNVEDDPYALAGVGVDLPINSGLRFRASARALFLSEQDLDDLSQPQQVSTSFMYSAGLTFSLGRRGPTLGAAINDRLTDMEERALTREERLQLDVLRTQAQLDSLRATLVRQVQADSMRQARLAERLRTDSLRLASLTTAPVVDSTATPRRAPQQFMQVPIPEQGEIYIRFGPPGGVRFNLPDSLAQEDVIVERDVMQRRLPDANLAAVYADSVAVDIEFVADSLQQNASFDGLLRQAVVDTATDSLSVLEEQKIRQDLRDQIDQLNLRIRELETQSVDSARADTVNTELQSLVRQSVLGVRADSLTLVEERKIQQDLRDEVERLNMRIRTMQQSDAAPDSLQQARLDALLRQALTDQARRDSLTLVEERKIQQDLRDQIERLRRDLDTTQQPVPPPPPLQPSPDPTDTNLQLTDSTTVDSTSPTMAGFSYGGLDAFGGFYVASFRPAVGLRGEFRLEQADALRFAPEVALALGGNVLLNLNLNALYDFNTVNDFRPYAGAGLGLVSVDGNNDLAFNLVVGAERAFSAGRFFGEFMTLDLFDRSRVAVGYRLSY